MTSTQLTTSLLRDVQSYHAQFQEPIPLLTLGRRYNRSCRKGTVADVICELHEKRVIYLLLTTTGARYVYPIAAWNALDEDAQLDAPSRMARIARERKSLEHEQVGSVVSFRARGDKPLDCA